MPFLEKKYLNVFRGFIRMEKEKSGQKKMNERKRGQEKKRAACGGSCGCKEKGADVSWPVGRGH